MKVDGVPYRTIWRGKTSGRVQIIDQTKLPFEFVSCELRSVRDAAIAISSMQVRGAPLIGATAAYGMCLAMEENASDDKIDSAYTELLATRPTAINLRWALDEMRAELKPLSSTHRVDAAYEKAAAICDEDAENCRQIGLHGLEIFRDLANKKSGPLNILTHCNAGWLACVDWGTATSPMYHAFDAGIDIHVWVDETRPRNQGAALTAWELGKHGIPHTIIADNTGGHLMQNGMVDVCITGSDRVVANGDVCNKIGTYLKALAADDNNIPFYVAIPFSTIDWNLPRGVGKVPIEERDSKEVTHMTGLATNGNIDTFQITSPGSPAANFAFDVTPARLITGLITERGAVAANALLDLYPEQKQSA